MGITFKVKLSSRFQAFVTRRQEDLKRLLQFSEKMRAKWLLVSAFEATSCCWMWAKAETPPSHLHRRGIFDLNIVAAAAAFRKRCGSLPHARSLCAGRRKTRLSVRRHWIPPSGNDICPHLWVHFHLFHLQVEVKLARSKKKNKKISLLSLKEDLSLKISGGRRLCPSFDSTVFECHFCCSGRFKPAASDYIKWNQTWFHQLEEDLKCPLVFTSLVLHHLLKKKK